MRVRSICGAARFFLLVGISGLAFAQGGGADEEVGRIRGSSRGGPEHRGGDGRRRLGIEGPTRELAFDRPGAASRALHVVAVGIDQYAAPSLKLGYARRDAETIARLMRASKGFDSLLEQGQPDIIANYFSLIANYFSLTSQAGGYTVRRMW